MKCHTSLWDGTTIKNYVTYKFENNLIYPDKFYYRKDSQWIKFCKNGETEKRNKGVKCTKPFLNEPISNVAEEVKLDFEIKVISTELVYSDAKRGSYFQKHNCD